MVTGPDVLPCKLSRQVGHRASTGRDCLEILVRATFRNTLASWGRDWGLSLAGHEMAVWRQIAPPPTNRLHLTACGTLTTDRGAGSQGAGETGR